MADVFISYVEEDSAVATELSEGSSQIDKEGVRALALLRAHLRLACELKFVSVNQYEHAARLADEVRRLVGGWMRRAAGATGPQVHSRLAIAPAEEIHRQRPASKPSGPPPAAVLDLVGKSPPKIVRHISLAESELDGTQTTTRIGALRVWKGLTAYRHESRLTP